MCSQLGIEIFAPNAENDPDRASNPPCERPVRKWPTSQSSPTASLATCTRSRWWAWTVRSTGAACRTWTRQATSETVQAFFDNCSTARAQALLLVPQQRREQVVEDGARTGLDFDRHGHPRREVYELVLDFHLGASLIPQAFSADHFGTRVSNTPAASKR